MEYLSVGALGDSLKCAYCRKQFTSIVKMVPQCGNSICGQCYEKARASDLKFREYECQPCNRWHEMPENGLADNLALVKMLRVQPEVRILPERAVELRELINRVHDSLKPLNEYNAIDEVISHCERLRKAVNDSLETKIEHLRKIEESHLKKIADYQTEMVDSLSEGPSARPSKRSRRSETSTDDDNETTEEKIRKLNEDFERFSNKWNDYFTKLDQRASEADLEAAHREVGKFDADIKILERILSNETFKRPLNWREDNSFMLKSDHLGLLADACTSSSMCVNNFFQETSSLADIASDHANQSEVDTARPISGGLVSTLKGHTQCVYQITFLPDGKLASCSTDRSIKIWKPDTKSCIQSFNTNNTSAISLAALPNGWLAVGCRDDSIWIFDLTQPKPRCVLKGHTDFVFMFRVLKDANLASIAWDNTIKIWDPYSAKGGLLRSMSGHGNQGDGIDLGILSNGYLVSCSNNKENTKPIFLKIWDPIRGLLVKSILSSYTGASSLLVLSDDRIAIGCSSGEILIYDVKQEANVVTLVSSDRPAARILSMVQLSNGFVVSSGCIRDPSIKIWNVDGRKLVETIETGHTKNVWSLSLCPGSKYLASSSEDSSIKLWSLNL